MARTKATTSELDQIFIREVNVHYRRTKKKLYKISKAADVADFVRSILIDNSREHIVALYLDASHQVASYSIISIGTANSAPVTPREVFQRAVLVGAIAVVLAHNHPSGSTKPSEADGDITTRIASAGEVLSIKLLDHIIVTDDSHYSFSEEGRL